ncbi:DJ-1/PfpI family protein [Nocardia bhagyanarayanae]|uniref:DJ-1/PfpI family protein n=1 Tax=Nocardia bhagyanarayanae TaxID=1215925 RepID=A0A543FEV4_9NOCA|nr:DJ-1/PfpI family protein [Nocardia bhagyanarayanae]TQM32398.1 DJ-1/PfpI family protein [Nocardia bhagyanarayanae]
MSRNYTIAPGRIPPPRPLPEGRINVAVVLGHRGSVAADALAPFEVFARSAGFAVFTVAARRTPVALSGGLTIVADRTFDDAPPADVVVVPAVVDPEETAARHYISSRSGHGALVLSVCAGAKLAAASGVLRDRTATSFWDAIDGLADAYPDTRWVAGKRYVEDANIISTAGVTSGVVGALKVVERLAGRPEAARIGAEVAFPGWTPEGTTDIPAHGRRLSDLPYLLDVAFPYFQPRIGVRLGDGVGELDLAAVVEVYAGSSFAAHLVPVGDTSYITSRHGLTLFAHTAARVEREIRPGKDRRPGEFAFDPPLRDLAAHTDRATARVAAKFAEYPDDHLRLDGAAWPWRPTILAALTLTVAIAVGFAPG